MENSYPFKSCFRLFHEAYGAILYKFQPFSVVLVVAFFWGYGAACADPNNNTGGDFLTVQERQWLDTHATELVVAPEANYPPFSFSARNSWQGLSADMTQLVATQLGVRFTILPTQNLDAILDQAQRGKVSIITSLKETPQRAHYLSFTPAYVSVPTVVLVKTDSSTSGDIRELAGKKVAVGKGYGVQAYLEQHFPEITLVLAPDDLDGMHQLSFGAVDAVIMDIASASYFIEQQKITNLRVAGTFDYTYDLSFGVRKDLPTLHTILSKTLLAIPAHDRQAVIKDWIRIEINPLDILRSRYPQLLPTFLAILVALFGLGTMAWIIVLRRAVERKSRALRQKNAELARSNAELEQFSYAISHDLRQPLRMISSYLQLLQDNLGDALDGENHAFFGFAIDGAKRMDAMMLGLLEYARVGRKGGAMAWIDSRTVLDEALLFLRPQIVEAQAKIHIEGQWPRIFANSDEILRLLQNLIGNAIKYRVAGRVPEVTISSATTHRHWRLCVADNGVGIAPDQIVRLFQVFSRLQSRANYEGTGVGLALCRKIAEHHGGVIQAESQGVGQGSRFILTLPMAQEEPDNDSAV